jgi:hypothetical protein
MKITKQRLRKIIKEELSNVLSEMNEDDYHAVRLRLQIEYKVKEPSKKLIEAVYGIWPDYATEPEEVPHKIDLAIKMAIADDAEHAAPAMSLEEEESEWVGSPTEADRDVARARQKEIKSFEAVADAISEIRERLDSLEGAPSNAPRISSAWGSEE